MQKKLIALALASLAGSAFAQSNVTIYGVADGTFEIASATGATNSNNSRGSFTRFNSNSSLLGFKGSEALGNGLTAVFQFESGINLDGGGLLGSQRDTFVGLAGGFGTVVGGLITGPTRGLGSRMDLNAGATGPGANSSIIGKPIGGSGAGLLDTRLPNTVAYVSPTFSGFSGVIGYMSGENKSFNGVADTSKVNLKAWDLGLNYINGPIDAGFAYARVDTGTKDNTTVTTGLNGGFGVVGARTWDNYRLGASYTFNGGHKIAALWDHAVAKANAGTALVPNDIKDKRTTWGLGGKFMVTPAGGLIAQYYRAGKLKVDGTNVNDTGAQLFEIGYEHSLSKRTMLKASFSEMKNKANEYYDFNVGAVNANTAATVTGPVVGADPKVFAVGVRHTF